MSIKAELSRLQQAKSELRNLLISAGVTVPTYATIDQYPSMFQKVMENNFIYQYKATFLFDAWSPSGSNYTQTVHVIPNR